MVESLSMKCMECWLLWFVVWFVSGLCCVGVWLGACKKSFSCAYAASESEDRLRQYSLFSLIMKE